MQSFKLATKKCCSKGKRKSKKSNLMSCVDRYEDCLLKATYIFCSCMIIFSLLMFNGLLATEGDSVVSKANKGLAYATGDIWYSTLVFIDDVGYKMGSPLEDTIQLYSKGLQKTFVTTGESLAKIVHVITAPPPYVMAKGY